MKKAYSTEILIILLAGLTGFATTLFFEWYWKILIGSLGFSICSYLIGVLKEQTLYEYKEVIKR